MTLSRLLKRQSAASYLDAEVARVNERLRKQREAVKPAKCRWWFTTGRGRGSTAK